MTERTYLNSKFEDRARVKALGARWDADARKWYVPSGLDLDPFVAWLPAVQGAGAMRSESPPVSESRDVELPTKGIPLSRLLGGMAALVSKAFAEGVWTTAEILKVSSNKGGHLYLELSERNPATGEVLAQARAVIWARSAQSLVSEFRRVTGAELDAGIKVLLRAKPVFKAQFGFSLEVDGIDPAYTLGDLEARRRDIRERLKKERLFDCNRAMPPPWDFSSVLVIAPERAAGLGDFAKEAQRLQAHGACEFSYIHSRFQGEGAAAAIAEALRTGLRTWSGTTLPDAVVIIRGGGAVSDLAWLNDYSLARCVCECPVPVLTGIGHERDETSLDEVAHRKFDTPSKVILGIEEVMRTRVREARTFNDRIINLTKRAADAMAADVLTLRRDVEQAAKSVVYQAHASSKSAFEAVRHASTATLRDARSAVRENVAAIRSNARQLVQSARQAVPAVMVDIDTRARGSVVLAKERSETLLPLVLERGRLTARAARRETELAARETAAVAGKLGHVRRRMDALLPLVLEQAASTARMHGQAAERLMRETAERATRGVDVAAERSQALFREIAGQGPQKTLRRGFAMVRSSDGEAVTSAAAVQPGTTVHVELHDGSVQTVVTTVAPKKQEGGA